MTNKIKQIGFFDNIEVIIFQEETDFGPFYRAKISTQESSAKWFLGPHARSVKNAVKFAMNQYVENIGKSNNMDEF